MWWFPTQNLLVKKRNFIYKRSVFNRADWSEELHTATKDQKYTGKQVNTQHGYVTVTCVFVCVSSVFCITYWVQYLSEKQKKATRLLKHCRSSLSSRRLKTGHKKHSLQLSFSPGDSLSVVVKAQKSAKQAELMFRDVVFPICMTALKRTITVEGREERGEGNNNWREYLKIANFWLGTLFVQFIH